MIDQGESEVSNPIEEAIAALRHGDQATAFTLLRTRLAQEPKDATAWLWMSEATPDIRRKVEALTRFLDLAPTHAHTPSVRLRLQQLQGQLGGLPNDSKPSAGLMYEDDALPVAVEPPPPSRTFVPPSPSSENSGASLRDRIATAPQPVTPVTHEVIQEDNTPVTPISAPVFTPRPAAPPPPNFKPARTQAEEDDGLPGWVWALMGLAVLLIGLFLYLIFNFERVAFLFQ
jgi:hypothetical protein